MFQLSQLCEAIAATPKKNEKVRLVANYFRSISIDEAAHAAIYLSGHAFPRREERFLSIGFSVLLRAIAGVAKREPAELSVLLRHHGDLGAGAAEILQGQSRGSCLSLQEIGAIFSALAAQKGATGRQQILEDTFEKLSAIEAKYFVKIATRELRIGLQESLVEEAIALAWQQELSAVQRVNMLTGDIGETLRLAAANELSTVKIQLFRPISSMLASAAETPGEIAAAFPGGALIEDKFDGIRAQVHKGGARVEIYSRTLDRVVEFPELIQPLKGIAGDFILDGEIVGWRDGRSVPFTELQQRLGRKQNDLFISSALPVSFAAFDLLFVDGAELLDVPFAERRQRLERLLSRREIREVQSSKVHLCRTAEEIEAAFRSALGRGNEGLLAKAADSPYVPGRRGKFWMKLKRPLATLDVVVTAAEYGHGKRRGLLSDYTFAVRDGERLVNIGKAYSGVTDAEIRQLTDHFLQHTVEDLGQVRQVEPLIVLEIAFNNVQKSSRHNSGYALRFPRIVRLRQDKPVSEIDTLDRLREIFETQHQRQE
jgi:DNA ligase-1